MSMLPFEVGQKASLIKRFGAAEVKAFAGLSEDFNPLHLDPAFAATTPFERPIVHGMLLASLFSGLLGQQLPGKGTVYLGQSLAFKQPVFVGDEVTAEVEIIALRSDKPIITLATRILTATGAIAVSGEAVVKFG
ncbi:TPA: MaoC family dehydratase [Aeromonas hydrophila]|uniref:MaoC family dehydratase n=1 Tax=Aeromonas hydrophila TaxID=644 RepID=UPI000448E0EE|nr:MaoC family dehydratase [Aeromonas hydrophila]AZU48191.1 enoyl-CoA hydratase [Aeromonas hydrophila]EZH77065.1 enoyl-CoA hydratase [Aeromonas hydrophila AD9]MCV3292384.1 MaoC family dehydratase [Aeromonas hydrophila]OSP50452.1 enoyl-CoA hydratase [Aeromonas hydrophila]QBX71233.1 MaoC family dehydratase [Aeromonas hydrophila]